MAPPTGLLQYPAKPIVYILSERPTPASLHIPIRCSKDPRVNRDIVSAASPLLDGYPLRAVEDFKILVFLKFYQSGVLIM